MNRFALVLAIALSAAIGFVLGASWPFVTSTVEERPARSGEGWESHGMIYVSEQHAEDPNLTLKAEVRKNVLRECSAQLAERHGLPAAAASALVQSRRQIVDLMVEQTVEVIESHELQAADRTELYAAFGRGCMQAADVLYFGGKGGGSIHWQPGREADAPHVEPLTESDNITVAPEHQ